MLGTTAILLFTRTSQAEGQARHYISGASKRLNAKIAQHFITHTKSKLKANQLPVFLINSDQQKGQTFGQRLSHAFQTVFSQGYQQVIAVGNDCPDLSVADIQAAQQQLQHNPVVVGPDQHGGTYLIGLHQRAFNQQLFEQLPWQSSKLCQTLSTSYAQALHSTATLLGAKVEVDQFNLLQWLRNKYNLLGHMAQQIKALIGQPAQQGHYTSSSLLAVSLPNVNGLRAPPQ